MISSFLSLPPSLPPSPPEHLAELMTGALSRALDMQVVDHKKALAVLYVPLPPSLPPSLPPPSLPPSISLTFIFGFPPLKRAPRECCTYPSLLPSLPPSFPPSLPPSLSATFHPPLSLPPSLAASGLYVPTPRAWIIPGAYSPMPPTSSTVLAIISPLRGNGCLSDRRPRAP